MVVGEKDISDSQTHQCAVSNPDGGFEGKTPNAGG
jgi:hypothetical protein